jgi:DnaJ family protein A protein 5
VLSDPHERKWYDDHREAILRGGNGTAGEDGDADDSVNVWKYFNSTCYTGHSDDSPKGFYTVYREVFNDISQRESDKSKSDPTLKYATATLGFGDSTTPIAEVLKFYAEWENFASKLNFAWADTYHTVDAPNRATRRVMEAENTKSRNAARKEYTNNVRSLATFVKKRDPRFVAYEAALAQRRQEAEELKMKQKAEELQARKEKRERIREEYAKNTEEIESRDNERKGAFLLADVDSDEDRGVVGKVDSDDERQVQKSIKKVSLDDYIAGRDAGAGGDGEDEGAGEGGAYACALCAKEFKTEAQLTQHNASKPHRKKAQEAAKSQKKSGGKGKGKEAEEAT